MALTRKTLIGMGLSEEQVDAIIEGHNETVEGLKKERDDAKETIKSLTKEKNDLKKQIDEAPSESEWEEKFNKEHKAFEDYKAGIAEKETKAKKCEAYTKLLKAAGIGETHIKSILGVTNYDELKLDKEGNLEDQEKINESIEEKWSGFKTETHDESTGGKVDPPGGTGATDLGKLSMADYIAARKKKG
jgi:hypothetical protein